MTNIWSGGEREPEEFSEQGLTWSDLLHFRKTTLASEWRMDLSGESENQGIRGTSETSAWMPPGRRISAAVIFTVGQLWVLEGSSLHRSDIYLSVTSTLRGSGCSPLTPALSRQ